MPGFLSRFRFELKKVVDDTKDDLATSRAQREFRKRDFARPRILFDADHVTLMKEFGDATDDETIAFILNEIGQYVGALRSIATQPLRSLADGRQFCGRCMVTAGNGEIKHAPRCGVRRANMIVYAIECGESLGTWLKL